MKKSYFRLMFEGVPFHSFFEDLWLFIRNPEIVGERSKDSSLHYSGKNLVTSLVLVATIIVFFKYLFPGLFSVEVALINPFYLAVLLLVQTVVFAFILSIITSIFLIAHKRTFHYLIALQAIQAYAVLNLFLVVMLWLVINRVLKTGNVQEPSSSLDLWLGGFLAVVVFWFVWRLLINPLWGYAARYYSKKIALGITVAVISVSGWLSSYAILDFGEWVINKPALCKQIFETKKQQGKLDPSVDEWCFIGHCMAQN